MTRRLWLVFVTVVAITLALDQSSKAWARGNLPANRSETVIAGYWDWQLSENPGAAFSSFPSGSARYALAAIAAAAVIGIGVMVARTRREQRMQRVAYALIAGGALGNLVDRLRDGAVTDFVRWRVHDHMWPIFNVADVALVIGVALLVVDLRNASRCCAPRQRRDLPKVQ